MRWATLDCYGTLIDWEAGIASALGELWPEREPLELVSAYFGVEPRIQAGSPLPYREVLGRGVRAVAHALGLALPAGAETALAASLPRWPPFPEVPEALERLRERGWRLGVLSNTDPDLLAASLERIGVPMDLRITAAEAGSYKPAHGHWRAFFETSGARIDRHVHVAASLFHDIEPAAALGLRAVWIHRTGPDTGVPRAGELPDLAGVPDLLDALVPA